MFPICIYISPTYFFSSAAPAYFFTICFAPQLIHLSLRTHFLRVLYFPHNSTLLSRFGSTFTVHTINYVCVSAFPYHIPLSLASPAFSFPSTSPVGSLTVRLCLGICLMNLGTARRHCAQTVETRSISRQFSAVPIEPRKRKLYRKKKKRKRKAENMH